MRLDKELIRKVMLEVEMVTPQQSGSVEIGIAGYTKVEVDYHIELLTEAGLIRAREVGNYNGTCWVVERLTFSGHEFLDTIRDGEVWRRTKEGVSSAGSVGLKLLGEVASAFAKQILQERLGLHLS